MGKEPHEGMKRMAGNEIREAAKDSMCLWTQCTDPLERSYTFCLEQESKKLSRPSLNQVSIVLAFVLHP